MSNEAEDVHAGSDDSEAMVDIKKRDLSNDDTLNDSGMFFSPLTSKLVRCASTPLSDKSLQSLLTLDFESINSRSLQSDDQKSKSNTDLSRTEELSKLAYPELIKTQSELQIAHVCLDRHQASGHQDGQELFLSFKCPDSAKLRNIGHKNERKPELSDKNRPQHLSEDDSGHHTSDSGIGSDVSASSSPSDTLHFMTPSPIVSSKDRDIFDSRKQKRAAAVRPLQRGVRFAHIPGIYEGQEKIDFIGLLSDMGMAHLLSSIWSNLTIEDLGRAQQVCSIWHACLISDRQAGARWKEAKEIYMENLNIGLAASHRQGLLKASPRKALSSVINILVSPSKLADSKRGHDQLQPPVVISPSKVRYRMFAEEASHLGPDEQLQKCPRCSMPCRVDKVQSIAKCTRISCQFSFCTKCMCSCHDDQPCRTLTSRMTRSKVGVASKKSRSRLRRL